MISTCPFAQTPTTLYVVPRSIPTTGHSAFSVFSAPKMPPTAARMRKKQPRSSRESPQHHENEKKHNNNLLKKIRITKIIKNAKQDELVKL